MDMPRDGETVGERLKWAMKRAGLRNPDIARIADVHVGTVSQWRSDEQAPKDEYLEAIAPALLTTAAWLRYGGEPPLIVREPPAHAAPDAFQEQINEAVGRIHEAAELVRKLALEVRGGRTAPESLPVTGGLRDNAKRETPPERPSRHRRES